MCGDEWDLLESKALATSDCYMANLMLEASQSTSHRKGFIEGSLNLISQDSSLSPGQE